MPETLSLHVRMRLTVALSYVFAKLLPSPGSISRFDGNVALVLVSEFKELPSDAQNLVHVLLCYDRGQSCNVEEAVTGAGIVYLLSYTFAIACFPGSSALIGTGQEGADVDDGELFGHA